MIYIKTRSRRYLDVSLRDTHGLNALDRLKINECCSNIKVIKRFDEIIEKEGRYSTIWQSQSFTEVRSVQLTTNRGS